MDGAVQNNCDMTGTFYHAVDSKGRINFPVKLREQLGATFWLSRGTSDKCLIVHSPERWAEFMVQIGGLRGPEGEKMRRWICAGAVEVTPDKQGRILIPVNLREYAGLKPGSEVAVVGAGRKAEIWDKDRWTKADEDFEPSMAASVLNELIL